MSRFDTSGRLAAASLATAIALSSAPGAFAAPVRHPAYTFTSLVKTGLQPIVGDIDWMPDGRLALVTLVMKDHDHASGPSDVLMLSGVLQGRPEAVTVKKFASGFYTPQGIRVVDGQVYVLDNKEGLLRLADADGDGVAEARSVVWSEGIRTPDRKWSGGLAYRDGFFYIPISTRIVPGGRSDPTQGKWNGVIAKISRDGSKAEAFAGGLRNVNGISWGPGGELIVTDNQGDWTPTSRVNEARQGEFFGHAGTAFADQPITAPILWLPHGELANSPSNTLILGQGRYKGQMLIGEVTNQRILRAHLEKVGGRLQGAVFPFAWDMPAGVNRLLEAPDGSGSIIVAGVGGNGGWTFKTPWYDLERMTPTSTVPFEMFAVRSLGPQTMEVEFTKPIAAADAVPARFTARRWRYQPTSAYGGAKIDETPLAVQGVSLSADGLKATLTLQGLQTGHVVLIRLVNMKSRDGEAPYATDAWYTLNAFGPGATPTALGPSVDGREAARGPRALRAGAGMALSAPGSGPGRIRAVGADGRTVRDFTDKVRP